LAEDREQWPKFKDIFTVVFYKWRSISLSDYQLLKNNSALWSWWRMIHTSVNLILPCIFYYKQRNYKEFINLYEEKKYMCMTKCTWRFKFRFLPRPAVGNYVNWSRLYGFSVVPNILNEIHIIRHNKSKRQVSLV
jgi:hypothetical protein